MKNSIKLSLFFTLIASSTALYSANLGGAAKNVAASAQNVAQTTVTTATTAAKNGLAQTGYPAAKSTAAQTASQTTPTQPATTNGTEINGTTDYANPVSGYDDANGSEMTNINPLSQD